MRTRPPAPTARARRPAMPRIAAFLVALAAPTSAPAVFGADAPDRVVVTPALPRFIPAGIDETVRLRFKITLVEKAVHEETPKEGPKTQTYRITFLPQKPPSGGTVETVEIFFPGSTTPVKLLDGKVVDGFKLTIKPDDVAVVESQKAGLPMVEQVRVSFKFATPGQKGITLDVEVVPAGQDAAVRGSRSVGGLILDGKEALYAVDRLTADETFDDGRGAELLRVYMKAYLGLVNPAAGAVYSWKIFRVPETDNAVVAQGKFDRANSYFSVQDALPPGRYVLRATKEGVPEDKFVRRVVLEVVGLEVVLDKPLVIRKTVSPKTEPTVDCKVRLAGPSPPANFKVWLTSKTGDGRGVVSFPNVPAAAGLMLPLSGDFESFKVAGEKASGRTGDAMIEFRANGPTGPIFKEVPLTVLFVEVAIRTEQDAKYSAGNCFVGKPDPARLGVQQEKAVPFQQDPFFCYQVEFVGTVMPSDFRETIILRRDIVNLYIATMQPDEKQPTVAVNKKDIPRGVNGGNDTSGASFRCDTLNGGRVYDTDGPGLQTNVNAGKTLPKGSKYFYRASFLEYASYQGQRCSDDLPWFVRLGGEKTNGADAATGLWERYLRPEHPEDVSAGKGQTNPDLNPK